MSASNSSILEGPGGPRSARLGRLAPGAREVSPRLGARAVAPADRQVRLTIPTSPPRRTRRAAGLWVGLLLVAACWERPLGPRDGLELAAVRPETDVDAEEPVRVSLNRAPDEDFAVHVREPTGLEVPFLATPGELDTELELRPRPRWPGGAELTVEVESGEPAQVSARTFHTAEREGPATAFLRSPAPGTRAPPNLRYVVLSGRIKAPLSLESDEDAATAVPLGADDAVTVFELPAIGERAPGCRPLCPGRRYRLRLTADTEVVGEISTGTVADETPPTGAILAVTAAPRSLEVEVSADEPVFASAEAASPAGGPIAFTRPRVPSATPTLTNTSPVAPESDFRVVVELVDPSGNRGVPIPYVGRTPPDVEIALTEVVHAPVRDWNDAAGPFDGAPGPGSVTDADEWIELVNVASSPLSLDDYDVVVRALDSSPTETLLRDAPFLGLPRGDRTWWPGQALVVHLRGAMTQRGLTVEVALGPRVLDRVTLGAGADADHPGGPPPDLEHEAVARDGLGRWRWCRPTPGDPAPASDCR